MTGADHLPAPPDDPGRPEPVPSEVTLDQPFDARSLVALRNSVAAHAAELGMAEPQVDDLVLVVHELASNAVRHGGGRGHLRMWRTGRHVRCQVSDPGPGRADIHGRGQRPPAPGAQGGRGMWLVRQLTHHLDVHTGRDGTRITATVPLAAESAPPARRHPGQAAETVRTPGTEVG